MGSRNTVEINDVIEAAIKRGWKQLPAKKGVALESPLGDATLYVGQAGFRNGTHGVVALRNALLRAEKLEIAARAKASQVAELVEHEVQTTTTSESSAARRREARVALRDAITYAKEGRPEHVMTKLQEAINADVEYVRMQVEAAGRGAEPGALSQYASTDSDGTIWLTMPDAVVPALAPTRTLASDPALAIS